ncbi:MAG: hypothetical protein ABFR63_01730, partial [Thermodesulfobacteriota bacterium]
MKIMLVDNTAYHIPNDLLHATNYLFPPDTEVTVLTVSKASQYRRILYKALANGFRLHWRCGRDPASTIADHSSEIFSQ